MAREILHTKGGDNCAVNGRREYDMVGESSMLGRKIKFSARWEERIPRDRVEKNST